MQDFWNLDSKGLTFHNSIFDLWPLKLSKVCFIRVFVCRNISIIKVIYSENATKFCKISTLLLSYVVPVKSKLEILQTYVAFSEYMNFKRKIEVWKQISKKIFGYLELHKCKIIYICSVCFLHKQRCSFLCKISGLEKFRNLELSNSSYTLLGLNLRSVGSGGAWGA